MKRFAVIAALLLAVPVLAQTFVYTNDTLSLDPLAHPLTMQSGAPMRYTIYPVQGGSPLTVSGLTGQLAVVDRADGVTVATFTGAVVDATTFRFTGNINAQLRVGASYVGRGYVYLGAALVAQISDDYISVAEGYCSTCKTVVVVSEGGGSTTNVTGPNLAANSPGYFATGTPLYVVTSNTLSGVDGSGLTNLPASSGGAQSPLTNNVAGAGNWLSNFEAQVNSRLIVGPNNTIGATATNFSIGGGAGGNTVSNGANNIIIGGSAHNVAGGANSGGAAILSGTNNSLGASSANSAIGGGRQNRISGGWESFVGGGNMNYVGNDYSVVVGGYHNSNATVGASSAVAVGGEFNRPNGKYSQVLGGVSNSALATGSTALGNMATVALGGTNAIAINCDPAAPLTNATPKSLVIRADSITFLIGTNTAVWSASGPTWNGAAYP